MKSWTMSERKAFYIQASCLCLEAISLRDSEQPAENITNYQVPLSQICCGLGLVVFPFFFDGLDWAESKKMDPRTTVVGLWLEGWQCRRCTTDRTGVLRRLCCERAATRHQVLSCHRAIVCSCACAVTARYHSEDSRQRTPPVTQPANSLSASLSQSPAYRSSDSEDRHILLVLISPPNRAGNNIFAAVVSSFFLLSFLFFLFFLAYSQQLEIGCLP